MIRLLENSIISVPFARGGGKEAFVKVYEHIEGKMDEMKKK